MKSFLEFKFPTCSGHHLETSRRLTVIPRAEHSAGCRMKKGRSLGKEKPQQLAG